MNFIEATTMPSQPSSLSPSSLSSSTFRFGNMVPSTSTSSLSVSSSSSSSSQSVLPLQQDQLYPLLPSISSLINSANELYLSGELEEAIAVYDFALQQTLLPTSPSTRNNITCSPSASLNMQVLNSLSKVNHCQKITSNKCENVDFQQRMTFAVDLFQEDECDVGPRPLITPASIDIDCIFAASFDCTSQSLFTKAVIAYNKGLIMHQQFNIVAAQRLYQESISAVQAVLRYDSTLLSQSMQTSFKSANFYYSNAYNVSSKLLELGMRVHNNMGQICYIESDEEAAKAHFDASLTFAKHLAGNSCNNANTATSTPSLSATTNTTTNYFIEYATVLSNRCRVCWMCGDVSDSLYADLFQVLQLRAMALPWNHPDVAAAHFNIAIVEYARQQFSQALTHFSQYLHIAACNMGNNTNSNHMDTRDSNHTDLDLIPALIYVQLIRHEDRDDSMSQELVRGLRTLQDKRQDQGPHSTDVASVLNYVGTLLFHKGDFQNALMFFEEELRIEEESDLGNCCSNSNSTNSNNNLSISVTCNNIGRILQELGNYHDAIRFYKRALKTDGTVSNNNNSNSCCASTAFSQRTRSNQKANKMIVTPNASGCPSSTSLLSAPSTANLYSTAWYNLGLIHDKLGLYDEAIHAFKMSLGLRTAMLGKDHPDIACLYYNIGVLQMEQKHLNDASLSFKEALRIRRSSTTGQLNDSHIVRTLDKLASMHKEKGNIAGALEAFEEIVRIQEVSPEYNTYHRQKSMGVTLRSVADLHHATGNVVSAIAAAVESARYLEEVVLSDQYMHSQNRTTNSEQLVSTLLMVGSLYHELNEPIEAQRVFERALAVIKDTLQSNSISSILFTLQEVTQMLCDTPCAPQA